ncbi:hypothetical protein [Mycoplasmopsis arginini]|uniref:hypothetical protein n=1 Tax=Mycoplasmopsis arginini TaxID=2094 RepID=UPI003D037B9C
MENYLDNYAKNFSSEENVDKEDVPFDHAFNIYVDSNTPKQEGYKQYISLAMQSLIFSASKKDIIKYKDFLNNFITNWNVKTKDVTKEYFYAGDDEWEKSYWKNTFVLHVFQQEFFTKEYYDEALKQFINSTDEENSEKIAIDEDASDEDGVGGPDMPTHLDRYNDKYILVNIHTFNNNDEVINPFFRFYYINLYKNHAQSFFEYDRTPAFGLIRFFNKNLFVKEKEEKIKLYEIQVKIARLLYQHINRDVIFDHYRDYFIAHNADREKANKRYNYISNYINTIDKNIDILIKEPLVLEMYKLSLTDDIDKVDENFNKFLEFLDSKIQ